MKPLIVCSKGRALTAKFLQRLREENFMATIAVEPQEFDQYHKAFPNMEIAVMADNDQGLGYARNFAKSFMENRGVDAFWLIDDDMSGFYRREGTKLIAAGMEVFDLAENQFTDARIAYGSLEYRQFAWSASKPLIMNSFCDGCYYINNRLTKGLNFDSTLPGKVDRDFAMQVIKAGLRTARTTLYAFSTPACGSNAGGQKEIMYDKGLGDVSCDMMIAKWGSHLVGKVDKGKDNATSKDIKIHWDRINYGLQSLF
jgi:hypothetical protein